MKNENAKNANVTFSSSSTCNRWERAPSTCSTQSSNATNPSPRFKMFKCSNVLNVQMFKCSNFQHVKMLKMFKCLKMFEKITSRTNELTSWYCLLHKLYNNKWYDWNGRVKMNIKNDIAYDRSSTTTSSTATCGSKSLVTSPAFTLADPASYF